MTVETMLRMLSAAAVPAITRERAIRLVRIDVSLARKAPSSSTGELRTGTVSPLGPPDNDPTVPVDVIWAVRLGQAAVK